MCRQLNYNQNRTSWTQVNCKICLKSAGLREFFGCFCDMLFEGVSPLKKFLIFDGLSRQETIQQHFVPHELFQDCGYSYQGVYSLLIWSIYIFVWAKYLHSSSLRKTFSCRSCKMTNHGRFQINPWFCGSCYLFFWNL